jgi:hypothetical protein
MSYGAIAAATTTTTAASAAQHRQMLLEKEEEEMTQYTQDDLGNDWEFKIVRSNSTAFRKQEVLDKLLEEEARAGWTMLEKLDDSRIRFKRPRRARAQDAYLPPDVDPYRTHHGTVSSQQVVLLLIVLGLALFSALGVGMFVLVSR